MITWGMLLALLATGRVPVTAPAVLGRNMISTVALSGGKLSGQCGDVPKAKAASPPTVSPVSLKSAASVFVTVTYLVWGYSTATVLKFTWGGVTVSCG
jgi:hypothetical protein